MIKHISHINSQLVFARHVTDYFSDHSDNLFHTFLLEVAGIVLNIPEQVLPEICIIP